MIACAPTISPPAPRPCSARNAISSPIDRLKPAQQRAGQEDQDRGQEHRLAAVHVAELPVQRRRGGRGQQVGGHDPAEVVEPAEVADDRRQRGRDDRLVERGQEHAEHQRAEDRHERAAGQHVGFGRCVAHARVLRTGSGRRRRAPLRGSGRRRRRRARRRAAARRSSARHQSVDELGRELARGLAALDQRAQRLAEDPAAVLAGLLVERGSGARAGRTRSARRRPARRRRAGAARRWRCRRPGGRRAAPARSASMAWGWIAPISASRVGKWR